MSSRAVCVLLSCCLLSGRVSLGDESAPARAAADALNAIKAAGTACPPSWSNASVDKVERLDLPSGLWHLAHVTAAGQRAGYVLLLERERAFVTVMYSASDFPQGVARALQPMAVGEAVLPKGRAGPEFPLIGLPEVADPGITVKPVACCLASALWNIQQTRNVPCFYGPGSSAIGFDTQSGLLSASPGQRVGQLGEYGERRARVLADGSLFEPVATAPGRRDESTQVRKPKDACELSLRLQRLIRSELQAEWPRESRWRLLEEEHYCAATCVDGGITTAGRLSALILQTYLDDATNLSSGFASFARSRGLLLKLADGEFNASLRDQVACILYPDSQASLLMVSAEQSSERRWALVSVPKTVVARRHGGPLASLPESDPRVRARTQIKEAVERGRMAAESRLTPEQAERLAKARERRRAVRASDANEESYEDPRANDPEALASGAHWVRIEALRGAPAIWIVAQ